MSQPAMGKIRGYRLLLGLVVWSATLAVEVAASSRYDGFPLPVQPILNKIYQTWRSIKTVEVSIAQKKEEDKAWWAGKLKLCREPIVLRIDYDQPQPWVIYGKGETVWQYSPAERMVWKGHFSEALFPLLPFFALLGPSPPTPEEFPFYIRPLKEENYSGVAHYRLEFVGKPDAPLRRIWLWVNKTTLYPSQIWAWYEGEKLEMKLSNYRILPDQTDWATQWELRVPAGVEVMEWEETNLEAQMGANVDDNNNK